MSHKSKSNLTFKSFTFFFIKSLTPKYLDIYFPVSRLIQLSVTLVHLLGAWWWHLTAYLLIMLIKRFILGADFVNSLSHTYYISLWIFDWHWYDAACFIPCFCINLIIESGILEKKQKSCYYHSYTALTWTAKLL